MRARDSPLAEPGGPRSACLEETSGSIRVGRGLAWALAIAGLMAATLPVFAADLIGIEGQSTIAQDVLNTVGYCCTLQDICITNAAKRK